MCWSFWRASATRRESESCSRAQVLWFEMAQDSDSSATTLFSSNLYPEVVFSKFHIDFFVLGHRDLISDFDGLFLVGQVCDRDSECSVEVLIKVKHSFILLFRTMGSYSTRYLVSEPNDTSIGSLLTVYGSGWCPMKVPLRWMNFSFENGVR